MANPWLKKNPFLSMWLSAVNRSAGLLRGHALAQARQQAAELASPQAGPKARKPARTAAAASAAASKTKRGRKG